MSSPTESSQESGGDNDPTITTHDLATIGSMWRSRINCIVNLGSDQHMPDLFEAFMASEGPQREQPEYDLQDNTFWEGNGDDELPDREEGVESDEETSKDLDDPDSTILQDFGFELPRMHHVSSIYYHLVSYFS